jgi:8-oxo-dGTP pyrophosphatase MutT (NUDIX family)
LPQRVAAIQAAISTEPEPLVTLTHLLQLCRDEHPVLWEQLNEPGCRARVAAVMSDVQAVMATASTASMLEPPVRRALSTALTAAEQVPAVVVARALAELVDERYGHGLAESFRRRSPYQPGVGDPVPLDNPDLRLVTWLPATSPPWRLANRLDETRHVRLAGEWAAQFRVIFDYSHADALTGLIGPETVLATCHPNRLLAELEFPVDAAGLTFGVRPVDEVRQHREIDRLISAAVTAGATVVVLPELCVTESLATQLQDWTCRPGGPRLLVAGSYHHDDEHPDIDVDSDARVKPRRRNTAIAYVRGCPAALTQDKHSPADRPVNEDIQPTGWPELRVHVSDDGWHLMIAICRDLLNPHAVHALSEAGVNLALVPAMSETLVAFGGPVAHLVGTGQAFVAVANNPADFSMSTEQTVRRPARALFGHPGFGQQTRLVQPADGEPGVALLRVQTGQLKWLATTTTTASPHPPDGPSTLPRWAGELRRLCQPSPSSKAERWSTQLTFRAAAVLVLLTDGPHGPSVLLTQRAPDLNHYPGQLVFPGGTSEPGDDGAISTALREAAEETGLDTSSVQVLGTLPALALPESGFLLTPVLAWSARPAFTTSANLAEVSAVFTRPLNSWAHPESPTDPLESADEATADSPWVTLGAVTGTVIDLILGMLSHSAKPPEDRRPPPT